MENEQRNRRIWITALIICQTAIILYQLFFSQSINSRLYLEIQNQTKESAKKTVQLAYNSIEHIIEKTRTGEMEKDEARTLISGIVRKLVYTDDMGQNYVFMSSYDGTMLVQPFNRALEGTNQLELKDADGNYIIRSLIAAAKKYPEGSYVVYSFYPPNLSVPEKKLSYVMGIPEIEAYIGTGMYATYSFAGLKQILNDQKLGYTVINMLVLVSLLIFISALYKSNSQLSTEIIRRKQTEARLKEQYVELESTRDELQQNHDELSALYEELTATEEELRKQYDELINSQRQGQELAERYMLVAEGSSDIIWDWDFKTKKLFVSDRFSELLGYPKDEVKIERTEDYWKYAHPADREKALEIIRNARKTGLTGFSHEYRMIRKDGGICWFNSRSKFIYGEDGMILRHAGSTSDITQRKQHEEEIKKLAYYDYLTGLPNRVSFADELKCSIEECKKNGCSVAVTFIDLDNFKFINDTFGHSYGDRVLVLITERLEAFGSENVKVFRIGGDEFILIHKYCGDASECIRLTERLLSLLSDPISINDSSFQVTCSIGVAMYPKDGSSSEEIFKNADLAMYKAKNSGKNKYVLYERSMGEELSERLQLEMDLREAFENGEFELYYQPQVETESRRIKGFEALLRWNSPKYGQVSPGKFIPIAEEIGLINDIGKWVIEQSFAFAKRLQGRGLCISCNVSPIQLIQSGFTDTVIKLFQSYKLEQGSVALEITENSLVESFEDTSEKLKRLRKKGILVYLDDFGTGYSSLTYLKSLPIDIVKIDKLFVDDIITGGPEKNIVKSIISLAHDIGLKVVAEGVEEELQREYLAACRCCFIQGYLISRPVPEKIAVTYLSNMCN